MELIYNPDQEYLNNLAADILCRKTGELLKDKDYVIWSLPGGRSVGNIFDLLSSRDDIEWSRVHFFMTDERMVPIEHDDSNFKLILDRLLYPLLNKKSISKKNIHPFILSEKKEDSGLDAYKKELTQFQDYYDISLLSSGEDSHIAGLFPDHSTIRDNSAFYIKTADSPKPPPDRMSSSRKLLARSDTALLLFYGQEKNTAFGSFMDSSQSVEKCPARVVLEVKNSYILTDQKYNGE